MRSRIKAGAVCEYLRILFFAICEIFETIIKIMVPPNNADFGFQIVAVKR
jgi:hypothetical protein